MNTSLPRPRQGRLAQLLEIMRCPMSGDDLALDGDSLVSRDGRYRYNVVDDRPVTFFGLEVQRFSDAHLSNSMSPLARATIGNSPGLVLNLSAGGSERWFENVVEVEAAIFRNTDVVADAHALPFKDNVFDAVVAMNAFEHYHSPHVVAAEVNRILKPGGAVAIHTAFLQPLHEAPHHFFNCTEFGLREWFRDFEIDDVSVSPNFNPIYAISWILYELETHFSAAGDAAKLKQLRSLTLAECARYWADPATRSSPEFSLFAEIPEVVQKRVAAGFQLRARKR